MDEERLSMDEVKDALSTHGISVARLCRRADLAESTWHRWNARGVEARDSSWDRVLEALRLLITERQAKAAA